MRKVNRTRAVDETFCAYYVTTANLSHDQQLSKEVGSERSLLVMCSAFPGRKDGYGNFTVKEIPKAVLSRCEWGGKDVTAEGGKPAEGSAAVRGNRTWNFNRRERKVLKVDRGLTGGNA